MSHYFDHAATTPLRPGALGVWVEYAGRTGNPSAIHGAGRAGRKAVEEAREILAEQLNVSPSEVIFTSGGTEADNLAVLGIARARRRADPVRRTLLISPVEHHAVLDAAHHLADEGFTVLTMPVGADGGVDAEAAGELIRAHAADLAMVSLMNVNNETGVIQPVGALAELARESSIPFHCDAVQGLSHLPAPVPAALSLSGHKIGGPMGVGALVLRRDTPLAPTSFGGGQESRRRSGTVPVPLVQSFTQAVREHAASQTAEQSRLSGLSERLRSILRVVGAETIGDNALRAPTITYALFPGCNGQDLVMMLESRGIDVSTGSACTAGAPQPSHVLLAIGRTAAQARSGLRFSLGWTTTDADLDALAAALPSVVEHVRLS